MINLSDSILAPFINGQVGIKILISKTFYHGGIKDLILKDGVLKIQFVWLAKLENLARAPTWRHSCDFTAYEIRLAPFVREPNGNQRKINLFAQSTGVLINIYPANGDNVASHNLDPLLIADCPSGLKLELKRIKDIYLSALDLSQVPKINFDLQNIPSDSRREFLRIDLQWRNKIWNFIRLADSANGENKIYNNFLDEVAERFLLTRSDIEKLNYGRGGGKLWRQAGDNTFLEISGQSQYFGKENDRQFTRKILHQELAVETL